MKFNLRQNNKIALGIAPHLPQCRRRMMRNKTSDRRMIFMKMQRGNYKKIKK